MTGQNDNIEGKGEEELTLSKLTVSFWIIKIITKSDNHWSQ